MEEKYCLCKFFFYFFYSFKNVADVYRLLLAAVNDYYVAEFCVVVFVY